MGRRDSAIIEIEPENASPEEVDYDVPGQQELEDLEGTDVNESEFTERL